MFKKNPTPMSSELDRLYTALAGEVPGSDDYTKILNNICLLNEQAVKTADSKNKMHQILGGIGQVGLVVIAGATGHIIDSKALGFIAKMKH